VAPLLAGALFVTAWVFYAPRPGSIEAAAWRTDTMGGRHQDAPEWLHTRTPDDPELPAGVIRVLALNEPEGDFLYSFVQDEDEQTKVRSVIVVSGHKWALDGLSGWYRFDGRRWVVCMETELPLWLRERYALADQWHEEWPVKEPAR